MGCVIYGLADPRTGALRYVGKTSGAIRTRWLAHLSDVRRGRVFIPRHRWISEVLSDGFEPEIFEIEKVDGDWREAEQFWIAYFRGVGAHLLNATAGGDGLSTYRHREDTRKKQSAAALARYQRDGERERTGVAVKKGHAAAQPRARGPVSDETRAKLSAIAKVHRNTPEARAAVSERFKGRRHGAETKAALSKAMTGRVRTPESIAKQVATMTGRRLSPETRAKMVASARARYGHK